jgi:hypothetical protein
METSKRANFYWRASLTQSDVALNSAHQITY